MTSLLCTSVDFESRVGPIAITKDVLLSVMFGWVLHCQKLIHLECIDVFSFWSIDVISSFTFVGASCKLINDINILLTEATKASYLLSCGVFEFIETCAVVSFLFSVSEIPNPLSKLSLDIFSLFSVKHTGFCVEFLQC